MELDKKALQTQLESLLYTDARFKDKKFFSFNDLCKEFGINKSQYKEAVKTTREMLIKLSYPYRMHIQSQRSESGDLTDVFVSPIGAMFILAVIHQQNKKEDTICLELAKILKEQQKVFYPETRLIARQEYTEVTKKMRGRIKLAYLSDSNAALSKRLSELYSTILCQYYGIESLSRIQTLKFDGEDKKYLDYISAQELKDLCYVQKIVLEALAKYPFADVKHIAKVEASTKRREFFEKRGGESPLYYKPHTNKPLSMYKNFRKLMISLGLEDENINTDKIKFEKA